MTSLKVINVDDWVTIPHRYVNEKISKRQLAKLPGGYRGSADRALAAETVPRYERMPATVLAERVVWSGTASLLRVMVAAVRPEYAPSDPADRLVHDQGKAVRCGLWFPHQPLPLGYGQEGKPPLLVITRAYSGFVQARMIPSSTTEDLLGGMLKPIQDAGAVPAGLVATSEAGIGRGKLTDAASAFAGVLGTEIKLLPPRDA
ncbi:hypothetical protein AAGW05_05355 [Arthrobacter sp. LAPM80]|uniref:hypothetical protein n=1 Tax=Arthrobacter sp. LAPM80 TaxID=3141788 RepID=UPI00398ACE58